MLKPQCATLPDGSKEWRVNGVLHRDDGPAVILANGTQEWRVNGKLHREDGPAVMRADGTEEYWEHYRRIIKNDQEPPSARM